jgi:4-amino-4-deoxy-L-arabinose transferase-like glycosyltransferase
MLMTQIMMLVIMNNFLQKIKNFRLRYAILFLIPLVIYFSFGLHHLTQFETADEHYWIYSNTNNNNYWDNNNGRIEQYWSALLSGNWIKTRINDKPGITLAYVSGIGSWLKTNLEKNIEQGIVPALSKNDKAKLINQYFRLPILIFNGFFSIFLFYLIRKLTQNYWTALLSVTFILLSPIVVGISQIVNPDALLWEFCFASLLSFLIYIRDSGKKFAVFSSVFLGLALLTKYSSVIFLPFFLAIIFLYIIENIKSWPAAEISTRIRKLSLSYFFIIAGALAIYAIILPDNLVELRHFMKGSLGFNGMQSFFWGLFSLNLFMFLDVILFRSELFSQLFKKLEPFKEAFKMAILTILPLIFIIVILNAIFGFDWFNLFVIPFDSAPKSAFANLSIAKFLQVWLAQFMPLIFSLSPIVILALLYAWIKNISTESESRWIIFIFSFFTLVFVAASFQQKILLTNRYSVLLYPLMLTMAAIGITNLFSLEKKNRLFRAVILAVIIFISISSLWKTKPFYFTYSNVLLPQKYLVSDAWGYGGFEAAQYLNSLPNAENLKIWADYNGTCLFFNGGCEANFLTMHNIRKKEDNMPTFQYFVSSRRGSILSKSLWKDLREDYQSVTIWEKDINNRPNNFIKIYKNEIYKDQ